MDNVIDTIFEKHQVRKSKKQKTAFIEYATKIAQSEGWEVNIEKGTLGARNIVVGNPDSAKVVYGAHYDTCAVLPFPNFITPKCVGLYILYNIALVLAFIVAAFLIGFAFGALGALLNLGEDLSVLISELAYLALLALLLFGPSNKHTANDNTSGVVTLFGLIKSIPQEQRGKVAIVFFDLEESGCIGSSSFASKHKHVKDNVLMVNFDCVSDGENMLVYVKKDAAHLNELFESAYASTDEVKLVLTNKAFYPSDQANFKLGVGVAALLSTKKGLLYMDKIHTPKDTVFRYENIEFLVKGTVRLTESL